MDQLMRWTLLESKLDRIERAQQWHNAQNNNLLESKLDRIESNYVMLIDYKTNLLESKLDRIERPLKLRLPDMAAR